MEDTISSGELTVKTRLFGGELTSICDTSGTEYLWQGDPKYWKGQAPVLFPIVGSLRGKTAFSEAGVCRMERHGVVRHREFEIMGRTDDSVTYSISSDEETKSQYPYDFRLETEYTVSGRSVTVKHTVYNPGKIVLPFQIGGHPAFNCPLTEGEAFEDYDIVFPQPETADCPVQNPDGTVQLNKRVPILRSSDTLPMKHELFAHDALIFDGIRSRRVTLRSRKSGRGVCVSFPQLNYLLVWSSANGGPFVALEPWSGLATCSDEGEEFEKKRGMLFVTPGERMTVSYKISVF